MHRLLACSLTVHAIVRGVSVYHTCLERSMSTSYQVSNVSSLTNPNALCVTAGVEYISACVSPSLIHDTTSVCIIVYCAEDRRAVSARPCIHLELNKARLLQDDYGSEKMVLVSRALESFLANSLTQVCIFKLTVGFILDYG